MRSNGGVASVAEAAERPVTLMLSGPAAGVLGAQWAAGARRTRERLITFDMGGTSADIGIVDRGRHQRGLGARHADRRLPAARRRCSTSRRSAPAAARSPTSTRPAASASARAARAPTPGPACYGHGGDEPTITDAHLVLGRLDPERFLGGEMPLDADARPGGRRRAGQRARHRAGWRPPRGSSPSPTPTWRRPSARSRSSAGTTRASSRSSPSAAPARCTRPSSPTMLGDPRGRRCRRTPASPRPPGLLTSDLRYDQHAHGLRRRGRDRRRRR